MVAELTDCPKAIRRMPTRTFSSLIDLGPAFKPEDVPACAVCLDDFEDGIVEKSEQIC